MLVQQILRTFRQGPRFSLLASLLLLCGLMLVARPANARNAPSQPGLGSAASMSSGIQLLSSPAPACQVGFETVDSPWLSGGDLNAISAISSTDVWAVGFYQSITSTAETVTEHWNGSQWAIVASPVSAGILTAVDTISSDDVWAVGYTGNPNAVLAVHWDGTQWTLNSPPVPNPTGSSIYLNAVSASAGNDAWAVGTYWTGTDQQPLVVRWDGSQWSQVIMPTLPNPGYLDVRGVAAISPNDVWAVGYVEDHSTGGIVHDLILHWDGTVWSVVNSPDPGLTENRLFAVTAISSTDVWAVGVYDNRTLTLHWDGAAWAVVPSPNGIQPGYNSLRAISAPSTRDVWAAGTQGNIVPSGNTMPLILHWDGAAWSVMPPNYAPSGTSGQFNGIAAISLGDVWAVGPLATPTGRFWVQHKGRFIDVHPSDYFNNPVNYLVDVGAIYGYADCTFRPFNNTTRGQLSKIVVLAEGWPLSYPSTPTFQDVPVGSPFFQYIETAYPYGIISGYTCGTGCLEFRPGSNVTRAQLSKIIVLAERWPVSLPSQNTFRDVPLGDPFFDYIETAYAHDIISGYSCGADCLEFRPGNNATRGQIAKIVYLAVTAP